MPPPKRPKKSLTWMNELIKEDDGVSMESAHREEVLHERKPSGKLWQNSAADQASDGTESGIAKSELPVGTTMVRSDSMSSTDSLKENKVPAKMSNKMRSENGERNQLKLRAAGSENVASGNLRKPAQSSYSSKHPSLCVLLGNGHHHTRSDRTEGNTFKRKKKTILEGLMSGRPTDVKGNRYKFSHVLASKASHSRVEQYVDEQKLQEAADDRQQCIYQGSVDLSSLPKHNISQSRGHTATCTITADWGSSVGHHIILPALLGKLQSSETKNCGQAAPEQSSTEKICLDNEDDESSTVPPLLSLEYTDTPSDDGEFVSVDQGESGKTDDQKLVTFTIARDEDEESDIEDKSSHETVEYKDCKPHTSRLSGFNSSRGQVCVYNESLASTSGLRETLPQRFDAQNPNLTSSGINPYMNTVSSNGPTSITSSVGSPNGRQTEEIQGGMKSQMELHTQTQERPTSLNHCINSIVASVLLSHKERQQLNMCNDLKTNMNTQSPKSAQNRDFGHSQMESPPGEFVVNYPLAFLRKVLTPGEKDEGYQPRLVLPPSERGDLKRGADSWRISCSEEPDSMSSSQPYPSEKMEPSMCTVNSSYLGDSTILNSPSSAPADSLRHSPSNPSPPHQDDVHSPSMEITSSTSEVAKRPATSGLNGDDVKSGTSHLCQVCNDAASGFHYGVWSCEGCKAFFKRSLQGPVNYICPATNSCTIDKHRRKSCQACRLRKCIEMGMSRGNCREKKGPSQRQLKRKSQDNDIKSETPPKISAQYTDQSASFKREPQVCSVRPLVDPDSRSGSQMCPLSGTRPEDNAIHPLVEHLLKIEPPVHLANANNLPQETAEELLTSILHLADAELMDIVSWARGIPGYMELPLMERMHLLECAWMEILILGLLWRSTSQQDVLVFASDLCINRERLPNVELSKLFEETLTLVNMMRQYQLNQEQLVLLRACILLNAGVQNLNNEKYFQGLQDKVHSALHYTTIQRQKQPIGHVMRLLLFLPQLRQVSLETITLLSRLQQQRKLPPTLGLIGEILSKHSGLPTQFS